MIINVRGTSGSGKSTIVREVMKLYDHRDPMHVEGRRQPIGYRLTSLGRRALYVAGHYETECGGCDTISKSAMDTIHGLVRSWHASGADVLFEGLLVSAEARRLIDMHADGVDDILVIILTTPIEQCLEGILDRRMRRGASSELGPNTLKNLESKMRGAIRCGERFEAVGMQVEHLDRQRALAEVVARFGL